ncbi:MAG: hypothetical protein F4X66_13705 [Chloroflexi bacterium]|nr:hypothetical protein [Chloroflexota bacterium]
MFDPRGILRARAVLIEMGMGKDGLRPGRDAWRGKRSEGGVRKSAPPSQQRLVGVHRTTGEKADAARPRRTFNVLGDCAKEGARPADESVASSRAIEETAAPGQVSAVEPQA